VRAAAAPPAAALRWVSDDQPGYRRQRRGRGFSYVDADERAVRDPRELSRIRRLAIPPAYEQVWICCRPDGHIQATARDARGRKQYRYHPSWQASREATKFARLTRFAAVLPRIRARVHKALASGTEATRERVLATIVRLLDTTWLRIGNEAYRRANGSFGLSTLRRRHARPSGSELRLSFIGKSGVRHEARVSDRRVARVVRRCQELPGQELFRFVDNDGSVHRIDSSDVNDWLAEVAGENITAKDFRTWHASVQALATALRIARAPQPPSNLLIEVVQRVAQQLGNTPAVCRKAYIHPAVLQLGEALAHDDETRAAWLERLRRPATIRGLAARERRLLALLATPQEAAGH
jgi:DNA topoisomerase-1